MKLRICSTAVIGLAAATVCAGSASAGLLVKTAPTCDAQPLSTPFAPWLDNASYTPLSGGNFESAGAGWTMSGGARVAAGNESFNAGGASDANSMFIPGGGSVTSPTICVGLEHPTMRFFAKRSSGGLLGLSTMTVEVLFENNLGLINSLPVGVVTPSPGWQPTLPVTVLANLLPLLPGAHTPVAFRFTPLLGGDWSIDDVYVDPYQRR
jgi:hypothetical protein